MEVQVHIHMMRFKAGIYIFHFFFISLLSFTLLHLLPCLEVFLSSYFLLSLPFLYFNILLLLILLCACLLHLFCQFGLYMYSSLLSLMKLRQGPPLLTSTLPERGREEEDPEMAMLCNFELNMAG